MIEVAEKVSTGEPEAAVLDRDALANALYEAGVEFDMNACEGLPDAEVREQLDLDKLVGVEDMSLGQQLESGDYRIALDFDRQRGVLRALIAGDSECFKGHDLLGLFGEMEGGQHEV